MHGMRVNIIIKLTVKLNSKTYWNTEIYVRASRMIKGRKRQFEVYNCGRLQAVAAVILQRTVSTPLGLLLFLSTGSPTFQFSPPKNLQIIPTTIIKLRQFLELS